MTRRQPQQPQQARPEFSNAEMESYRQAIEALPQYRFDGILISSRERYLMTLGALKLENGEFRIVDSNTYKRINDLDARLPKEKFSPPPAYWAEIRAKMGVIGGRVVHAGDSEVDEIPF